MIGLRVFTPRWDCGLRGRSGFSLLQVTQRNIFLDCSIGSSFVIPSEARNLHFS
jgi:hypothetical protein